MQIPRNGVPVAESQKQIEFSRERTGGQHVGELSHLPGQSHVHPHQYRSPIEYQTFLYSFRTVSAQMCV